MEWVAAEWECGVNVHLSIPIDATEMFVIRVDRHIPVPFWDSDAASAGDLEEVY